MALCTTRSVGGYVASEAATISVDRLYKPNASKRPVIVFLNGGDDREYLTSVAAGSHIYPVLVEYGIPFISAAFGGALLWGNATTTTRIGEAWTYVKAITGCKTDKFVGIGVSKGFTAMANYTRANPANVAALVGIVPAVNVSDIYDNSRPLASQAEINAAYPSGGWAANKATRDPALNIATAASQAIPTKLIYGTSDTTTLASTITSYATAVGATAVSKGAYGHADTGPQINPNADVMDFISPYL